MTTAAVALGANLGEPAGAFRGALASLAAQDGIDVVAVSSLWRSAPWGREDQPEFLNGVALLSTSLSPRALLDVLLREEERAGRVRDVRWGPRPLDLDLLFHGTAMLERPDLTLPHPRLAERSFVLEPLAEVAPDWRHPGSGRSAVELRDELRRSSAWTACTRLEGTRLDAGAALEPACPR
ncbi:MAG: 2-amino-4-hydroxy-6-hydroxymethyldihydropteridine diphosphokinase [bacterium]